MKNKKMLSAILILICLVGIVVGAYQIYKQLHEYDEGRDSYSELEDYVTLPEEPDESEQETQSDEIQEEQQWPKIDFETLKEINPDIVGWMYIEGTEINYPIVQGQDNQYYLKHLFSGEWNSSGCLFLDARNVADFSDWNNIIYGHHMKNGTMFSGLTEYKNQEFYDAHPTILIMTPEQNFRVEVFAGYVANVKDDAWKVDFGIDAEYENWQKSVKVRSCFDCESIPAVTDHIITFSTCSYEFDDARFVLHGIMR